MSRPVDFARICISEIAGGIEGWRFVNSSNGKVVEAVKELTRNTYEVEEYDENSQVIASYVMNINDIQGSIKIDLDEEGGFIPLFEME